MLVMIKEYVTAAFQILTHCGESFPIDKMISVYVLLSEGGVSLLALLNSAHFKLFSCFANCHSLISSVDYPHRDTGPRFLNQSKGVVRESRL